MVEGRAGRIMTTSVGEGDASCVVTGAAPKVLEGAVGDSDEEASGEVAVTLLESVLIRAADGETDDS